MLWGMYKGFTKGLIISLANIAALFLGIWGGVLFSDWVSGFLISTFNFSKTYTPVIAFSIVFLGIIIGIYSFAKFVSNTIKAASLGFANQIAGAVFGVLKFALILSVLFFIIDAIDNSYSLLPAKVKEESLLYKPVSKIAPYIIPGLKSGSAGQIKVDISI